MNYKRRWWHDIYIEFHFDLPFVRVSTRLMRDDIMTISFDVCRVAIEVTRPRIFRLPRKKYEWSFRLYKRRVW
ncbi:Uncharacterised protein [Mycobacteroides abscessus subsp. abscessus]|nr:Uncharacterised protein [Mycobacteroides abscessus subsp. abscessus]